MWGGLGVMVLDFWAMHIIRQRIANRSRRIISSTKLFFGLLVLGSVEDPTSGVVFNVPPGGLQVVVEIPGSWFGGGAQGCLVDHRRGASARRCMRRKRWSTRK